MPAALLAFSAAALTLGQSVEGRPLVAVRQGAADAPVRVLAVGSIHGDEPAGHAVIRALRGQAPPAGVQVWTLRSANPDGLARRSRVNARGVDLNRNFPHRWRAAGERGDRYWPGPRAASEPETQAVMRLVRRVRPDVTVWLHQPYGFANLRGNDLGVIRRYARRAGLPVGRLPAYRGTAPGWENALRPQSTSFVVELPAAGVGAAAARRHARALLAAGADRLARLRAAPRAVAAAPRPPIQLLRWPYPGRASWEP